VDAEKIVVFLEALNAKRIRVKAKGWVEACCPLARWTHPKHTDSTPSFGVAVDPEGRSHFFCFSCESGSLEELLQMLALYNKAHLDEYNLKACHQLLAGEQDLPSLPPYGEHGTNEKPFEEWPLYWLESFLPLVYFAPALEYLQKRKVPLEIVQKFDLRFDSSRKMIVCPYYSVYGKLAGARGRAIRDDVTGPQKHWDYSCAGKNNCRFAWYNEGVLNFPGPAVVVEGQFDVWRVSQAYPKVVGNLTAKPTWEKMVKLTECPYIIQIPDNPKVDKAGALSIGKYAELCKKAKIGHRVLYLGDGVKDPDECCVEYLRDRIQEFL
jgi:hypothetical protein